MLDNLKMEMTRAGITIADICGVVKKSDRAIRERMKGNGRFSVPEAVAVRDAFFPQMEIEYLFSEKKPSPERDGDGKAQPGSRAYFKSVEIPGVSVTDVYAENGTVCIMLVCEDWVSTETARRQYETFCRKQIPIGMGLQVNAKLKDS